ncbi:MAG: phosphoenolpyruvate synthase, partial [Parcubacteria group bacterium GW2011_GWB1_45_10]
LLTDYKQSNKAFSTRSSATIEDDSKDSMAGMFDTHLNVSGDALVTQAIAVIRSAFSPQIIQHLQNNQGLVEKMKIAVVLQEMVDVRCAGVIFGAKAQTGDTDIVEIEANQGLGEGIVSGEAKEVESYKFSRSERRVVERKGPEVLSQPEAKALFMLSERLRQEFNDTPQDIEWAIDSSGQIWVLQSRDLYIRR